MLQVAKNLFTHLGEYVVATKKPVDVVEHGITIAKSCGSLTAQSKLLSKTFKQTLVTDRPYPLLPIMYTPQSHLDEEEASESEVASSRHIVAEPEEMLTDSGGAECEDAVRRSPRKTKGLHSNPWHLPLSAIDRIKASADSTVDSEPTCSHSEAAPISTSVVSTKTTSLHAESSENASESGPSNAEENNKTRSLSKDKNNGQRTIDPKQNIANKISGGKRCYEQRVESLKFVITVDNYKLDLQMTFARFQLQLTVPIHCYR